MNDQPIGTLSLQQLERPRVKIVDILSLLSLLSIRMEDNLHYYIYFFKMVSDCLT